MTMSISNITTNAFTVNWTSHGSNVSEYNIEIRQGSTLVSSVYGISAGLRSYRFSYNISTGTSYEVKLYSRTSSGTTVQIEYAYPTTLPGQVGAISVSSINPSGFTLSWGSAVGASNYALNVRVGGPLGTLVWESYPSTTRQTITGLQPSTLYYIKVYASNSSGNGAPRETSSYTGTLAPPSTPSNFRVYDITTTAFSLAWNTVSTADNYAVEVYRTSNNQLAWSRYNITGGSVRTGALTSGVSYYAKLYASNAGGNSTASYLYDIVLGSLRPSNWSWSISKTKGRNYSISNGSFTNLVSYDEIISFRTRINGFRAYKGLGTYTFSSISRNSVFTAAMYNQMETAISQMNPPLTTYGQRASGSTAYTVDELLNRLRDSLNSIT